MSTRLGGGASALAGLPLQVSTPPDWAPLALQHLDELLVDHAHCEHKAASAALRLIARFPEHRLLCRAMLALAHEEMRHFRQVLDILERRGVALTLPRPDRYVNLLRRRFCSEGRGVGDLGDRLLVSAFVEARSCERFRLLARALQAGGGDPDLAGFYRRLAAAEARHWEAFRDLAGALLPRRRLQRRLQEVAGIEAEIVGALPLLPRMH